MNHKGPRGANGTMVYIAGIQKEFAKAYKDMKGLVGIDEKQVHLMDFTFVDWFHEEEVTKHYDYSVKYPYKYSAEKHGTTFMCMSENPLEFKKYPIEELAHDLIKEWYKLKHPIRSAVFYIDGTYKLQAFKEVESDELPVYTWEQLRNSESIDLETAILDYEEVMQDESNV